MEKLKLKVFGDFIRLENVMKQKRMQRNELIDSRRANKKDKEAVKEINKSIQQLEADMLVLDNSIKEKEKEVEMLQHKMGKIRLNCYLFADIIYNSLLEYKEFMDKHCDTRDAMVERSLTVAIDNFKRLPFEIGENRCLNEIYSAITDRFIEKWNRIRDGVIEEVMDEIYKEYEK